MAHEMTLYIFPFVCGVAHPEGLKPDHCFIRFVEDDRHGANYQRMSIAMTTKSRNRSRSSKYLVKLSQNRFCTEMRQKRFGIGFIEVFDDRERLRDDMLVVHQRGDKLLRIDMLIVRAC